MRWIACCLLVAVVGLGFSTLLVKQFASKPSDPNLAELGLASNLDELAAPDEPEPGSPPSALPNLVSTAGVDIENAKADLPTSSGGISPKPPIDPDLKPASYIDTDAANELDKSTPRWMPLCRDLDSGSTLIPYAHEASCAVDRMPRCDEPNPPQPGPGEAKRR
jgi:hypothetical protein